MGEEGLKDHSRAPKRSPPRTFPEGRTRLRFLAYSRKLHITNGLCFVGLIMSWVRPWGIEEEVFWQRD